MVARFRSSHKLIGHGPDSWAAAAVDLFIGAAHEIVESFRGDFYRDGEVVRGAGYKLIGEGGGQVDFVFSAGTCGTYLLPPDVPLELHRSSRWHFRLTLEPGESESDPTINSRATVELFRGGWS